MCVGVCPRGRKTGPVKINHARMSIGRIYRKHVSGTVGTGAWRDLPCSLLLWQDHWCISAASISGSLSSLFFVG